MALVGESMNIYMIITKIDVQMFSLSFEDTLQKLTWVFTQCLQVLGYLFILNNWCYCLPIKRGLLNAEWAVSMLQVQLFHRCLIARTKPNVTKIDGALGNDFPQIRGPECEPGIRCSVNMVVVVVVCVNVSLFGVCVCAGSRLCMLYKIMLCVIICIRP